MQNCTEMNLQKKQKQGVAAVVQAPTRKDQLRALGKHDNWEANRRAMRELLTDKARGPVSAS